MKPIIEVKNLSKQYRLGMVGTGSLHHDINRWWHRLRGKEDPYLRIGETNDRSQKGASDYVWALRDINFSVQPGEVLGIIGRNGAGKSTLLKILSRITAPTTGSVTLRGRVASLLEVGTGMHPELTGRENIYLNGAILGMRKKEIDRKLDAIVDFAGVERYLDTPVKRYSSGMHVRLGFAVAAHLEPDILIVDEVLAVGDAEFQKKCLGKMQDVSRDEGRTILFVSHNMTAVKSLCSQGMLLSNGFVQAWDNTQAVLHLYEQEDLPQKRKIEFLTPEEAPGNEQVRLKRLEIISESSDHVIYVNTALRVECEFWNYETSIPLHVNIQFYNRQDEILFVAWSEVKHLDFGVHKAVCNIPPHLFNDNPYYVKALVVGNKSRVVYRFPQKLGFEVIENRVAEGWYGKVPGYLRPALQFTLE